jgi:calcineurin-like phosphoesterase
MTPIKYSKKEDTTYFHYKFSTLRPFIYYALNEGNAGALLIARKGNTLIYKVSGTIEHPQKTPLKSIRELYTLSMKHNDIFDGKMQTDDERLI